jgi:FtsP/CotA-like multicopper oxidase with cupredoxin domain
MRRRNFLRAGAGALTIASLPRLSQRARAADVVDVELRSGFLTGAQARFGDLAYNGTIPGPLLRVTSGQRIRVRYVSEVDVPTSIHWHGMILPNDMDGVAGITQPAVRFGGTFLYDFEPGPPGTRWYHDHALGLTSARGLFGMFVVDDPHEQPADRDFALVFHDVPDMRSLEAAQLGRSAVPMTDPMGSSESMQMTRADMGDEVAYVAHCINGAVYPNGKKLAMRVGERVRLRILNASPTQTRYVRLAGHELTVTHADGNALAQPVTVEVLRVAAGERCDAAFEVRGPGAFLLQGLSSDPLASQQAVVLYTQGMESAPPLRESEMVDGLRIFGYELAAGTGAAPAGSLSTGTAYDLTLGGGGWGNTRWTINGAVWPNTPKLRVRRGEFVSVRFRNTSQMDHPMHLHGHIFSLAEVNGTPLARPFLKDVALVTANGGTATWRFRADSPAGRWMLHCHNDVHLAGGMMTELVYED